MLQKCCLKIKALALILTVWALLFSQNAFANECASLFSPRASSSITLENLETDIFSVVKVIDGRHGGNRYVIETKAAWHDFRKDFSEQGGDVVADMRTHVFALGPKAAKFFGYEIIDANHVIVPSVPELNLAIKKFNDALPPGDPRRLNTKYYETKEGLTSNEVYINGFIESGLIPISMKRKHFYHDISIHAMQGFYIPPHIISSLRSRIAIYKKFHDFLKDKGVVSKIILERILIDLAALIDLQANFAVFNFTKELRAHTYEVGKQIESENFKQHGLENLNLNSKKHNTSGGFTREKPIYIFLTRNLRTFIENRIYGQTNIRREQDMLGEMLSLFIEKNNYKGELLPSQSVVDSLRRMYEVEDRNHRPLENAYDPLTGKRFDDHRVLTQELELIKARKLHAESLID